MSWKQTSTLGITHAVILVIWRDVLCCLFPGLSDRFPLWCKGFLYLHRSLVQSWHMKCLSPLQTLWLLHWGLHRWRDRCRSSSLATLQQREERDSKSYTHTLCNIKSAGTKFLHLFASVCLMTVQAVVKVLTVTAGVMLEFVCVLWVCSVWASPAVDKHTERAQSPPSLHGLLHSPFHLTIWLFAHRSFTKTHLTCLDVQCELWDLL